MILSFLQSAIRFSTAFLFGSVGETVTEKSGNLNLGIPGIMCMGASGSLIGASLYVSAVGGASGIEAWGATIVTLLFALIFSLIGGLIYCVLTTSLRCNQNVSGLALTTFGIGLLSFCGGRVNTTGFTTISGFFRQSFPIVEQNWFTTLFLSYGALVYIAIILAVIAAVVIKKTRVGLNLRAVGENPATADAAGISVTNYKYGATLIGSMIAGLGGLFYIMDYTGGVVEYSVDTYGWMAVALVIFTVWRPNWAILGSIVFSILYLLPNYVNVGFAGREAIKMIPYLVTIVVLVITSIVSRRESQPPASLGLSYFREER
ncbi:MAG TPA: ABC transporter permease [Candidatus Limadaptatus stercoravium]|nr:ABC transporter permease [Candidatus Limadaptatus stercoravium]